MSIDANALLMGGGVKSAKFDILGTVVMGAITEPPKAQQMKKYQSEELDFWPSGDPKMQIIVTLQTDLREDAEDDGRRNLFIVPRMMHVVRDAVRKVHAPGLEVGGRLIVKWISGTGQGAGNPKEYAAEYTRPILDPGSLLDATPAATTPATQPTSAIQQPTTAPASGILASMTAAAPATPPPPPAGVDPALWAALPEQQRAAVLAAMGGQATPGY